jgi:hypothetical protein
MRLIQQRITTGSEAGCSIVVVGLVASQVAGSSCGLSASPLRPFLLDDTFAVVDDLAPIRARVYPAHATAFRAFEVRRQNVRPFPVGIRSHCPSTGGGDPALAGAFCPWLAPNLDALLIKEHRADHGRNVRGIIRNPKHRKNRECRLMVAAQTHRILNSSSCVPDAISSATQRGVLPLPDHVSDGLFGFRYFGFTLG